MITVIYLALTILTASITAYKAAFHCQTNGLDILIEHLAN